MNTSSHQANRLANETSPYLLQHAYNPVDWYPWGEEALARAREEHKPIIVSIGYSACHWCHVMEKECFEDAEVARLMNEQFINIKVDREERPDVDQIYMEAVQIMGVQGGWPLNVFLTAEQEPFYGGTYFPKRNWMALLQNVAKAYRESRDQLEASAAQFRESIAHSEIQRYGLHQAAGIIDKQQIRQQLDAAYQKFSAGFDKKEGGMNRAPKFPMPSNWLFLLRYYAMTKNESALQQVMLTLDKMASGGIYDQIGGGFARYSVDQYWFAPHFEKMLYDNGQLLSLYAEAFTLTKNKTYKRVIEETVTFVRRELTSPEGGFYSALDADSEGEEGKFYVWQYEELKSLLGDDANLLLEYYNVRHEGNWEHGNNILHTTLSDEAFARKHQLTAKELETIVISNKEKLLAARAERVRPGLDDKILTAWNGLMLKGLADAYAALQDTSILELAIQNAYFITQKLLRNDGALYRTYKNGQAKLYGYLEDYAFVIDGLLALYQVSFDEQWLTTTKHLADYTIQHFLDEDEGFFYFTDTSADALIARKKELFDNVIPASNSAMARNLHTLGILLDHQPYQELSEQMLGKMIKLVAAEPGHLSNWACLATASAYSMAEVAIVGPELSAFAHALHQHYYPFKLLIGTTGTSNLPLLQGREAINGKTTLYVCYDKACQLPVHSPEEAFRQMK